MDTTFDRAAAAADVVRGRWLRRVAPHVRSLVVERERRVASVLAAGIAVALLTASMVPVMVLALGPVVWGVPHLVADLRYLVVQRGLHRRVGVWLAIFAPIVVAAVTGTGSRVAMAALVGAGLVASGASSWRRAGAVILGVAALWLAHRAPFEVDLALAHLHNVVALALLWAIAPRTRRHLIVPFALFAAGYVFLLSGAGEAIVGAANGWTAWAGLTPGALLRVYAPFPDHIDLARRLVIAFAFGQTVHYLAWLRAVPDEAHRAPSPRSFRQSMRGLRADFGSLALVSVTAGAIALALWAFADLRAAREGYLRFAWFHGHLEIALALLAWVERRRP